MKIAIFTDSFLPGVGGTENAVFNFALALSKDNDVLVLAPKYKRDFPDDAYPFKIFRAKSIKITDNDFWAMPKISKNVKTALNEFKPDILHTQTLGMMADFANAYGKKHNIPVVCTVHTKYRYCYEHDLKCKFLVDLVIKRIIKRANDATALCAVSRSMAEELKSYGAKKQISVIKNGGIKREYNFEKPNNSDTFNFIYVGLVSTIKNIDFTLRALSLVKNTRKDFTFTIIGRGSDSKKLRKLTEKLGLTDNVKFTGVVRDRERLNEYYANANLFLFSSVFDTDGLVILEASNFYTPTLVLKGTGSSERITDGQTGFISDGDERSYADKILELMQDKDKLVEVGKNASGIFSPWSFSAEQYLTLYRQLLKKT